MTYKSIDSVVLAKMLSLNIQRHFILTAEIARITAYNNLQLTVGSIIIMLRNIDLPRLRIMVSTGLAVKKKRINNYIEATMLKGQYKRKCIPIDMRLAFAMSIN